MRTLLATLNSKYIHSNLAIRLLYQLNKHIDGLAWKEFTIKEDKDEIAAYCAQYDVVALSCYIWNITQTLDVCRRIKALSPKTKIMLGGPEVSYEYEPVIMLDEVDYIVVGEGEIPFSRFLEQFPNNDKIPGIVSKHNNQIFYLPCQEDFQLIDLEHINPYIDDDPKDLFNKVLYIETSRGCPYKCEFCLASLDNKVRYLTMDRIKDNLLYLMQHGRTIKFLDRTFNVKKDFTIEIFQFILDHHKQGNIFQFEITADILHPDIIRYVNDIVPPGLFRFEIGIQTVNQKANLEVSRKQNFFKTKGVIEQVRSKIEMHLDLIVGLPLDYWEDIKYSFEEVFKLFPPELQLGFLKFLKGTPVREKYLEHDYVFDPQPPYQIIQSKYLSKEELYQITQLEFALEAYWNKKRIIHTLKYVTNRYSCFDFLLGIGIAFELKYDYHKHTLMNIYEVAHQYIKQNYLEDTIMESLLAIDYYMQHKIKPKNFILDDLEHKEKFEWIESQQLNHHQYRYVVLDLPFNYDTYIQTGELVEIKNRVCIEYTGVSEPRLINSLAIETI
jgi:anaerobic magnesium-protoporphyrin IX monomethyl ester cyclase